MVFRETSRLGVCAAWAVLVLIAAARIVAVADGRDPGFDQAMLMASFPLGGPADYFRPLPLFEQAAPLGPVIVLDAISRAFGEVGLDRFTAARVAAALAAMAGYLLLFGLLRRAFPLHAAILAVVLIAAPQETLLFTTNPKHYVYEFFAACLLLRAAAGWLDRPDARRVTFFLAATLVACLFAYTAPLILIAVGGGMLAATLSGHGAARVPPLLGLGAAALALAALFYALYTLPTSQFQTAAYADRYDSTLIRPWEGWSAHNAAALRSIAGALYQMVEPAYTVEVLFRAGLIGFRDAVAMAALLVALIGFPAYWHGSKLLAGGLALGLLGFLALNALQALPIMSMRHFLFFTPFFGPCVALGGVTIVARLARAVRLSALAAPAVFAAAFGIGGLALLKSAELENTEISENLALVDTHPAPLWVYYGAQPSLRALRPDLLSGGRALIGLLPHRSTPVSWTRAARDADNRLTGEPYFAETRRLLAGTDPVWLVFVHTWPEDRTAAGLDRFVALAEADGRRCRRREDTGGLLLFCARPEAFPEGLGAALR